MEVLVFALNAIVIYLLSNRIVRFIERRRGGVMKNRRMLFFVIILMMAPVSFRLLHARFGG